MDLPPTWEELERSAQAETSGTLDRFVSRDRFSADLLNLMCVLWVIRQALPWARFQDVALRAAFRLANVSAALRSAVWAANAAKRLYWGLQQTVLETIKVSLVLSFCFCFYHFFV
jgi:hypothetical protein